MRLRKKDMIPCHEALSRLWAFLDGELEPEDGDAVRRHLEICKRCYPHYDFQRAYFAYVRRLSDKGRAPGVFRRRLFLQLAEQDQG